MQYEVEMNGRTRQVGVRRAGGGFTVTIDGRTFHVDVARVDVYTLSLLVQDPVRLTADATAHQPVASGLSRTYEVTVVADAASAQLAVLVGSTPLLVGVDTLHGRRRFRKRDDGAHAGAGPQRLVAPMPGKIVRVLVRAGDAVTPRQPLVVVEAMKMENELRAGRGGTIGEIHAQEGQSVEAGALLVVIL
jgi:biotin carboxyl carrier protein